MQRGPRRWKACVSPWTELELAHDLGPCVSLARRVRVPPPAQGQAPPGGGHVCWASRTRDARLRPAARTGGRTDRRRTGRSCIHTETPSVLLSGVRTPASRASGTHRRESDVSVSCVIGHSSRVAGGKGLCGTQARSHACVLQSVWRPLVTTCWVQTRKAGKRGSTGAPAAPACNRAARALPGRGVPGSLTGRTIRDHGSQLCLAPN